MARQIFSVAIRKHSKISLGKRAILLKDFTIACNPVRHSKQPSNQISGVHVHGFQTTANPVGLSALLLDNGSFFFAEVHNVR